VRAFVRKMISFGFGRGLTEFDKCVERDAIKALKADEYRVQNVVEQIVLSYAFRHRYAKK